MAKRRRFSISTFAELFVLLAIVFMVQTIANITLGKSTPETDAVRGTRIVLAQYPYVGLADVSALGRRADHLRYISVGEVGLVFSGVSGCHLTAFELAQPLSEQTDQGCRDIPRYVSERYNASLESQSEIDPTFPK